MAHRATDCAGRTCLDSLPPHVWLIAVDGPGYGLSDNKRDVTDAEWPDDVAGLGDALGLTRFWVVGGSGSAPYALACGWSMPHACAAWPW